MVDEPGSTEALTAKTTLDRDRPWSCLWGGCGRRPLVASRSMTIIVVATVINDKNYKDEYGFHGKDAWFHS